MNKYIFLLLFTFVVSLGCLNQDSIVGCWEYELMGTKIHVFFYPDGTYIMDNTLTVSEGKWERIDSERILLETDGAFGLKTNQFLYQSKEKNTFYVQNLESMTFHKIDCKKK